MREILFSILAAVIAYLLGSLSTGIILAGKSGVNLREVGSKNTGASNVLRVLGFRKGLITFVGDSTKAALACLIGSLLLPGDPFGIPGFGAMLGGLFAILGHNWPIFYGFHGGKGVACSVAVALFVNPLWGAVSVLVCVAVIAATRFISLGSLVLLLAYAVCLCVKDWGQWGSCMWVVLLFALCVLRHRANIQRMVNGTENKIGHKAA